jgi:hypothetical protein
MPVVIFDSNPKIDSIYGIDVVKPSNKYNKNIDLIILSTQVFQEEMTEVIGQYFDANIPIVNLYDECFLC